MKTHASNKNLNLHTQDYCPQPISEATTKQSWRRLSKAQNLCKNCSISVCILPATRWKQTPLVHEHEHPASLTTRSFEVPEDL